MIDRFHRNVTYLRISVTDRCQMSCTYCTLQEEPKETLTAGEIGELVRVRGPGSGSARSASPAANRSCAPTSRRS